MSYDKWWEYTDEDFKRKLIDQELEDADLQDNPIATEGWGVFLAKKLSALGVTRFETRLVGKTTSLLDKVFHDPRVVQWIDIQAKLIIKQAIPYIKNTIDKGYTAKFATKEDIAVHIDNPSNGVLDYDGTARFTTEREFSKTFTYNVRCGKYMLNVNADSDSIKRVFIWLKMSDDTLCLALVKAPDDQELLKIVGAIESCEVVDEGLISKVKSFIGSGEVSLEAAELYDFTYGVEQVSESLFTLDNLDDSTKMMLFGTAALGVVSAGVGFIKHIGYELGDTVGKGIRNKLNNREYKKFIRAVNDPEVQRFLKDQCNEVFEEAKKKFPNVTKKVSAVDGKAVETGAKKVKSSKGIIGRFFSSPNIIPVKAGEYLVILDGTPSEGVKTAVVVLQDADTKKYICSLLTPPTLMAESLGLGAMIGAAAVGTFIGKQIKKNRDAKRQELAAAMKAESDEDYKAYLKKAEAWVPSRKKAINEAISIVKKYWTYTSFYPNPKGFCYDLFISGKDERVCIGSIREILDEEFYKVLDRTKAIINKELFKRFKGKYVVYFGPEYLFGEDEDDEFDRKAGEGYVALVDMEAVKEYNKYWVKKNGWLAYTIDFGTRKPLTESFDVATEGWGVKAAKYVSSTGWTSAILGVLATFSTFGYALTFKAIWAMIIGGLGLGAVGSKIVKRLEKKANKYIDKALANPEMAAYIRSEAKKVVDDIKKQAASMKDSKYEVIHNIKEINKLGFDCFTQTFKAPGQETDEPIKSDSGYFYTEMNDGEYWIICLYDTNSIKGIYVVVSIKDKNDKYGSSWLRARPIPAPTSENLKRMGFKGEKK